MTTKELPKAYEPHAVEDRWIDQWIGKNLFKADLSKKAKPYSIVIPPPNVTGSLHMGHALNSTVQDILVRYHRMKGDNTLWVVGTDHAGIATQNVVERQLKAEGKSRFDLGREKFVERVWKWKAESGGTIISQLKRLGASCDFSNERFTMDEGLSEAVRKVFVSLHKDGLIYRGERLINWCPRCQTALSDLEVEHEDQKGSLWHIRYPLENSPNDALIVATTRPETLLGDTAVAVHPDDERYQKWIGKNVLLPLANRPIPVIADEYVDREFGSGVVKITPAHDFNDFAIGERHKLGRINILEPDGRLNANAGAYAGLSAAQARAKVVEDLEVKGLLKKIDPYQNKVGHCYRCKAVVEPYLSFQWFVKTKPLAEKAIAAVKTGKTKFVPAHWEKTYFNWMENIQDWCISRQIWWGHQIPAWYCSKECGEPIVAETPPAQCPRCGSKNLRQDEDVLDTWFSSGLWPFSTLGWPEKTKALETFYPTSVLVTAFDIIFFWVARMMMMGIHFMGEVPFKDVHIHALVRDPLGQKMSKSKGNVVDPLLMMTKYGTDAFRFTLASFAAQGRDIKLDEARIEGYRNFSNKIWNASRFAMMNAAPFIRSESDFADPKPEHHLNRWILVELARAIEKTSQAIENYEFNKAAQAVYSFFWHSFCDWYVELSKTIYAEGSEALKTETARVTYFVLDNSLRLLHPFMPFITEEIWQMLADRKGASIAKSAYPSLQNPDYQKDWREIEVAIATLSAIRSIRQETGLSPAQEVSIEIETTRDQIPLYDSIIGMISKMGRLKANGFKYRTAPLTEPAALARLPEGYLAILLASNPIDPQKEKDRVAKKAAKVEKDIQQLQTKLNDPKFMEFAEADLIAEKNDQLKEAQAQSALLKKAVELLAKA